MFLLLDKYSLSPSPLSLPAHPPPSKKKCNIFNKRFISALSLLPCYMLAQWLLSVIEDAILFLSLYFLAPLSSKVFIDTRSRMSSIMSEICQVTSKLFALELLKIIDYICLLTICHLSSTHIYWWILIQLHTNVGYDNISSKLNFHGPELKVRVNGLFLEKLCHCSSTCIYWWILIYFHTNVGYDNISGKLNFQGPGLKVKVTVAIFRKTLSSL